MPNIKADYHTHSHYSGDSATPPERMIRRAVELGLEEIAITDHLDFPYGVLVPYPPFDDVGHAGAIADMREKFAGEINVLLGLELGLAPGLAAASRDRTARHPYDFIITSMHDIDGHGLYEGTFFVGKSKREAYERYFSDVLGVIKAGPDFCVYGHLDYLERYAPYDDNLMRLSDYADIVDAILKELISRGKGLEVNTSGYRYGLGHTNPQPAYLRRYKELGGEILTVGSDAHRPDAIAHSFDVTRDMLLSLGFKYITRYRRMEPYMVKL